MSTLKAGKKRYLKRRFSEERATIWVGKDGASTQVLKEIEKQLAKNKTVKAKILKSALTDHDAKQFASKVAEQTGATLVEVRGHTFVLYKARSK